MKALTWKTQTKLKGDRDIDSTERQKLIKNKKNPGFPGGVSGKELTSQRRHKKKKNQILRMTKGPAMKQELRDPKTTFGN